jgi:serine/threonine protein kinase
VRQLGKYRLLEPVASGGMADVFRAEVPGAAGFVKQVAVKLIRGDQGEASDFVRMFIEEARLASRLTHANIVQVFEFDRIEGSYCIAMEFVHGRTLRQVVDRCRERGVKLGLPHAVHVCAEVAKALAYAHRVVDERGIGGIVHRDVSPQNILVSFEGEVKLTDFGIARAMGRAGLTEPGTIKGKAAYMAPEQARGGPIDARADVFSLAVVLWELCSGRRLFARDSDAATLMALTGDLRISPPSSWNEAVPADLDGAVMAALERDPDQRTRGAQELASALGGVLLKLARGPEDIDLRALMHRLWPEGAAPQSARPAEPTALRPASGLEAGSTADEDATTRTATAAGPPKRRRGFTVAAGVGLALAALGAMGVAMRRGAGPGSSVQPSAAQDAVTDAAVELPAVPPPSSPPAPAVSPSLASPSAEAPPAPAAAQVASEPPGDGTIVVATREGLNTLALPAPASGEGILSVNASPWGTIYVDGQEVGHTPREVQLRAGRHRVRVVHPTQGAWAKTVVVTAGRRSRLYARFKPISSRI